MGSLYAQRAHQNATRTDKYRKIAFFVCVTFSGGTEIACVEGEPEGEGVIMLGEGEMRMQ